MSGKEGMKEEIMNEKKTGREGNKNGGRKQEIEQERKKEEGGKKG